LKIEAEEKKMAADEDKRMKEEQDRLIKEAEKKLDEVRKHEVEMWGSLTHTEVQTTEWKKIQEEEVSIFHEFKHKLEEAIYSSHDNFVITIHEASEVK